MASLKRNVIANYIGQFYMAFVGILVVPLYLKHLGAEAFGLVGFFTLLQTSMHMLDMGISPTFGREVARLKSNREMAYQLRAVARSLESIFSCIAVVIGILIFLARHWIAADWLTLTELDLNLVANCVGLMAAMIAIRWLASLYKSGIMGYENQEWINVIDVVLISLRFPGSLLLIWMCPGEIFRFFLYQTAIAVVELLVVAKKFYSLLPIVDRSVPLISLIEVKRVAPFALSVAYTGGIWILLTQLDKLILTKVLPLVEFGYFTLIATVSGGLLMLSAPISKALLPRMTALLAAKKESEMLALYRKATRLVASIVAPVAFVLAFFAEDVIYIWTGDSTAAQWTAPTLPLFVLSSGLLAIGAFQYYLQYAHGQLRQHVIYNTISAAVSVPLISYAALRYGPEGVGWVWFILRLLSLALWSPYVHHLLAPGVHKDWLLKDVLLPITASACLLSLAAAILWQYMPTGRVEGLFAIMTCTAVAILGTLATSFLKQIRTRIYENL